MCRFTTPALCLVAALVCGTGSAADAVAAVPGGSPGEDPSVLLGLPPTEGGPVVVHAAFELRDINEIDDVAETFAFTGVMTLEWKDPRQAFEASAGMPEKVFQGSYQFNEISPGWYPQVVLANESGPYQKSGLVLRVQPDGSSTLIETIDAVAETELDMRWFPFDEHRLEAVFLVLGFDREEVVLRVESDSPAPLRGSGVGVPQWTLTGTSQAVRDRPASYAGRSGVASVFVVSFDIDRNSFYIRRLVTFPLAIIVLLSFSVFWMDRSSLGDRISVSFIGILTGVAYQLVMGDVLPRIAYFTLMNAFLLLSFLTMCATVVVNLVVGAMDKNGEHERGDRIDLRCRWMFPLAYFGLVMVIFGAATVFF